METGMTEEGKQTDWREKPASSKSTFFRGNSQVRSATKGASPTEHPRKQSCGAESCDSFEIGKS